MGNLAYTHTHTHSSLQYPLTDYRCILNMINNKLAQTNTKKAKYELVWFSLLFKLRTKVLTQCHVPVLHKDIVLSIPISKCTASMEKDWWNQATIAFCTSAVTSCVWWKCWWKDAHILVQKLHAHTQNSCVGFHVKKISLSPTQPNPAPYAVIIWILLLPGSKVILHPPARSFNTNGPFSRSLRLNLK